MRISEVIKPSRRVIQEAKGREYQHCEDFLIFGSEEEGAKPGAEGGLVAVQGLAAAASNPAQMNVKWDGSASVFWGRNEQAEFLFAPLNQWNKKTPLNRQQLSQEITQTGKPRPGQSEEEFRSGREQMASGYRKLWDIFEAATPNNFRGYLNGDLMFTSRPDRDSQGNYEFTPNKVKYVVNPDGFAGKMATAEVFVTVHGKIDQFGDTPTGNIYVVPDSVVEAFNRTPKLIVLPTQHPNMPVSADVKKIKQAAQFIKRNQAGINAVANFTAPKMTTFTDILYKYAVQRAKKSVSWDDWLPNSKLSANQLGILDQSGITQGAEWKQFWQAFDMVLDIKHEVHNNLQKTHGGDLYSKFGIRAFTHDEPGGEGYVWALPGGQMAKMVNPKFRSAPDNPRYAQSS